MLAQEKRAKRKIIIKIKIRRKSENKKFRIKKSSSRITTNK